MTDRCEPPPELQGVDGWHWISAFRGPLFWDCEYYGWNTEEDDYTAPDDCPANWRYIAPVASAAEVETLRARVGRLTAALRINGLRHGATDAEIDGWLVTIQEEPK